MSSIKDCFVTGKWEDDKDAAKLLEEDGMCLAMANVHRVLKNKYSCGVIYRMFCIRDILPDFFSVATIE